MTYTYTQPHRAEWWISDENSKVRHLDSGRREDHPAADWSALSLCGCAINRKLIAGEGNTDRYRPCQRCVRTAVTATLTP